MNAKKHNEMMREWTRRVREVHAHWAELGHDNSAGCSGHAYPNHGCPNPELHARLMPTVPIKIDARMAVGERT